MQRWLLAIIALVATVASAGRITTFAWDNGANWPAGTTVELCSNGVCATGLTGNQNVLDVPIQSGERFDAKVRAVAPAGYQCGTPLHPCPYSEWYALEQTWPNNPINPWVTKQEITNMAAHIQSGGAFANNTTSISRAFSSNVAADSLIVIIGSRFSSSSDAWLAGDCTKSSGTATISTISLDISTNFFAESGSYAVIGIWSAIVTGGGSLTIQCAGAPGGSYLLLATAEFSGTWDINRAESGNTNGSTSTATSLTSNNATSAGAAVFIGGSQINSTSATTITLGGSGWTSIYSNGTSTDDNGAMAYKINASGATEAYQLTISPAARYSQIIQSYKEAAGVAATGLPRRAIDGPFYGATRGSVR